MCACVGEREKGQGWGGGPCEEAAAWEATHRAPLDLPEVQGLGPVLDDDGTGANHVGGGAAARLESQHLEPLSRPRRPVGARGDGDRHVGVGELEQRASAGGVELEQLAARALDATESVVHWREGWAAAQPRSVPLQKHGEAERLACGFSGCELSCAPE